MNAAARTTRSKTPKTTHTCCAQVQRHQITTIQRIGIYKTGECTRKGTVTLQHKNGTEHHMCRQHAKLALQGFVEASGCVASNATRNDYQTGRVSGLPSDYGDWTTDDSELQHVAEHFKQDIQYRRETELAYRRRRNS